MVSSVVPIAGSLLTWVTSDTIAQMPKAIEDWIPWCRWLTRFSNESFEWIRHFACMLLVSTLCYKRVKNHFVRHTTLAKSHFYGRYFQLDFDWSLFQIQSKRETQIDIHSQKSKIDATWTSEWNFPLFYTELWIGRVDLWKAFETFLLWNANG